MQSEPSLPGELLGAKQIRLLAEQWGIRPTKQRGQNFVIDPNTIERIVREAHLNADDVVLEVGPGLGSLTLALLGRVRHVIAVEIDPTLATALPETVRERAPDTADRLHVICADAMDVNDLEPPPSALVANLPYNVSVPVLLHVLVTMPSVSRALVMVQREVGERLAATPGSKAYGVPSVKAQWFGSVSLVGGVPRTVFWPEPRVDSVLVYLEREPEPQSRVGREAVFTLVDAAFGQRRKMLRSAVSNVYGGKDRVEQALLSIGMPATIRGEQLTVHDFVHLADALGELT
jgi:16S rRNA (adenine1518-N6/adenine1519-N6)-dimethyltransferase